MAVRKRFWILTVLAAGIFFCLGMAKFTASAEIDLIVSLKLGEEIFIFRDPDIVYDGDIAEEIAQKGLFDAKGRFFGFSEPIARRYRLRDIDEKLSRINALVYVEPKNASVVFDPKNPKASRITDDADGFGLDLGRIKGEIEESLSAGRSYIAEIFPEPIKAELTRRDIEESLTLCTTFSTDISTSSENRKTNVRLALSKFNGKTFVKGEQSSFNEIVGPRTEANGFREAKVILDGEFVEGIGGGVCQASTTLYNALLLSGNKILEKHRHTLRVGYVPPSFDAMVSSSADLKFECAKKIMHIVTRTTGSQATVEIYAKKDPVTITRKSVIVSEGEPPAPEIEVDTAGKYLGRIRYRDEQIVVSPSKGELRSEGWLYYSDGRREKIRTDVYKAQKGKVIVGAEEREKNF